MLRGFCEKKAHPVFEGLFLFWRRFGVLFVVAVIGFVIIIGRELLIVNGGKRLLFLLFGFQFVVIGRFFDTELL